MFFKLKNDPKFTRIQSLNSLTYNDVKKNDTFFCKKSKLILENNIFDTIICQEAIFFYKSEERRDIKRHQETKYILYNK